MNSASVGLSGQGEITVTGDLVFGSVSPLLDNGKRSIQQMTAVTIDLAAVTHSDSAGLALLAEWVRFAIANKRHIKIVNMPPQMSAMAKATGIDKLLPIE